MDLDHYRGPPALCSSFLLRNFFPKCRNFRCTIPASNPVPREVLSHVSTPSEQEYEHLISHFERLLRLTTIILTIVVTLIVGAGSIFFYKSVGDMKDDEHKAVESVKASAQNDIAKAKEDVLDTVRAEAKKRVDDEFETSHITDMVEAAARRKVGPHH